MSGNYQYDNGEYEDAYRSYRRALKVLKNKHPQVPCQECVDTIEQAMVALEPMREGKE